MNLDGVPKFLHSAINALSDDEKGHFLYHDPITQHKA